ncbi:MAG: adenylate/guanylate cyclase domain-containing protein [Rhizobiales bacterium]|nr:adenylate/guanylate cyclase domain-containing protein [Hyphomicrobiales bacterium]
MKARPSLWRRWRRRLGPALVAGALVAGASLAILRDWPAAATQLREATFDAMLAAAPRPAAGGEVAVVDIDRAALDRFGPWPWPRERLAQLVEAVAAQKPKAIALDVLLAEAPGQEALAAALAKAPAALGAVLDPDGQPAAAEGLAVVSTGRIALDGMMVARGLAAPPAQLLDAARGVGVVTLPAGDGVVRAAPLLAGGGGALFAGLATEAARLAQGDATPLLEAATAERGQRLRLGALVAPLPTDGLMRLRFSDAARRARRTVTAAAVIDGTAAPLAAKIVFIGASAPEAGGLRATPADPFAPSVQIQADAAEQWLEGAFATRPEGALRVEALAAAILGGAAIVAALAFGPGLAAAAALTLALGWAAAAQALLVQRALLIDAATPALVTLVAFLVAALAAAAAQRRERRKLEARFAQHLSPEVVRRIAADPDSLRLSGEERTLTALTTDIEGFTALTERVTPAELIGLLDDYLDRVTRIVVAHGGMVDKIVGDAVLAFFNAPLDLDDHAGRAVRAALAIRDATEAMCKEPEPARLRLGRTRIGVETGKAVVGDVGGARKLDYTAYGQPINTAKKLEGANKLFGTAIAVGPGTVAAASGLAFRRVGAIKPSPTLDEIAVSEPVG